jgi:predicted transcriptional regulator
MSSDSLTIALPPGLAASLADLAQGAGRSPESVAIDAIAEHVAVALEMRASIQRGQADVVAGRVVSHEDVMADLADILDAADRARQH